MARGGLTVRLALLVAVMAACAGPAWTAQRTREPHIGYLYPAGARRGTTVEVAIGGQFLMRPEAVRVSGEGVSARIILHCRPGMNISREQREAVRDRLVELTEKRLAELEQKGEDLKVLKRFLASRGLAKRKPRPNSKTDKAAEDEEKKPVKLPDHPLLRHLEDRSLRDLLWIMRELADYRVRRKRQQNAQLSEVLLVELTVAEGAAPGDRELRLLTRLGLSNPIPFQVGTLPETMEIEEADDPEKDVFLPEEPALELPVLVNGQILPGDVDRLRFQARKGQKLVVRVQARRLVPFLADAVPGWFQAVAALHDPSGREVAYADDYRFDPDPVLLHEVETDGIYTLTVRDSIYRGREDFVYRISIGELPFITEMFPLGGRKGTETVASVRGWNLPAETLRLDTSPGGDPLRTAFLEASGTPSNLMRYAVGALEETVESEPNDTRARAERIVLPRIVNGRIERSGDVDLYRFEGRAGEAVVLEVTARRLHSPLDSLVRLLDASSKVLAWNDDRMRKDGHLHLDMGVLTHHADSSLIATLPEDGTYYVRVSDTCGHGGSAYAYRLRVGAPEPDFALLVSPSGMNLPVAAPSVVSVHALRRDGFDGEIALALKDAPKGWSLQGARIPPGSDGVRLTITPTGRRTKKPVPLALVGSAVVGDGTVTRPAAPADDTMQAFLWRHLVPSGDLVACTGRGRWGAGGVRVVGEGPIRVRAGGEGTVALELPRWHRDRKFTLEASDPPEGIQLGEVQREGATVRITVKAGPEAKVGLAGNLIVEVTVEHPARKDKDGKLVKARVVPMGVLPAIPFEVVAP
jgi:hypothetical protein